MLSAGIDIGTKTIKIVILKDGSPEARNITLAGFDVRESLNQAWAQIHHQSGLKAETMDEIVATGAGRKEAAMASKKVTEVSAAAKGAFRLAPTTRTLVDIGAEESRAIKLDENGRAVDFAVNEKCAAGTGSFTEAMARALEVNLEDLGALSLQSTRQVPMNAQCSVFAESEVVTLVHAQTSKPDIARAIHDAISERISSMVRRVGLTSEVMLIGGMAKNVGFVESLTRDLATRILIPDHPEYTSALGAALIGLE